MVNPKFRKKLHTAAKIKIYLAKVNMKYCKKYCNSTAILAWKTVLQSVLLYFFHQVLPWLLQYFLPVLLTRLHHMYYLFRRIQLIQYTKCKQQMFCFNYPSTRCCCPRCELLLHRI